ncbi:DUF4212 domain-containing protein [Oxalobacteraceae bacterium OM1]|nr:DUF4212 domain-containing protein [Oxalobacteraceae bacterium OM1]
MTPSPHSDERRVAAFWLPTRRFTTVLCAAWLVATFGTIFFARELAGLTLFGWPIPFFMAAQGLILFYVALVGLYAWRMQRMDRIYKEETRHAE